MGFIWLYYFCQPPWLVKFVMVLFPRPPLRYDARENRSISLNQGKHSVHHKNIYHNYNHNHSHNYNPPHSAIVSIPGCSGSVFLSVFMSVRLSVSCVINGIATVVFLELCWLCDSSRVVRVKSGPDNPYLVRFFPGPEPSALCSPSEDTC